MTLEESREIIPLMESMPFVLLRFHKEKGPAGTLHRFSSGSLPQRGGVVLPPVCEENGHSPIFSADSSNRTVCDNTAAGPPETFVPRFSAGHISCGEGPDCHRSEIGRASCRERV